MATDLAHSIAQISKITPGGMLIFFPSFGLLQQSFEFWEKNDQLKLISENKKIFKEPKDPK